MINGLNKLKRYAVSICCALPIFFTGFGAHATADFVNVYAGPQSISANNIIYITVQTARPQTRIELSYMSDGVLKTLVGMPENGLISFDVKAQKTTGVMSFTAQADGAKSNPALVKVHAAAPQSYTVKVRQSQDLGHVDLRSDLITDGFRNPISTLSFVSLYWIDASGLKSTQSTHLRDGRIAVKVPCPTSFIAPLYVRTVVHRAAFITQDLSDLCRSQHLNQEE